MNTDTLFYVVAILFAVPFTAKQIIHVYLDYKNGHKMYFGGVRQFKYFRKYEEDVSVENPVKLTTLIRLNVNT